MENCVFHSEWDLLTAICQANNKGNQERLHQVLVNNDFTNKQRALHAAMTAISLTKDNVAAYKESLCQFVGKINDDINLDFGSAVRLEMLREMLNDIA